MTAIVTGTRVLVQPDPQQWLPKTPWLGRVVVNRPEAVEVEVVDPLDSGMDRGKVRTVPHARLSRAGRA